MKNNETITKTVKIEDEKRLRFFIEIDLISESLKIRGQYRILSPTIQWIDITKPSICDFSEESVENTFSELYKIMEKKVNKTETFIERVLAITKVSF